VFQALYGKHGLWCLVNIICFLTLQTVPSVFKTDPFPIQVLLLCHEVQPALFVYRAETFRDVHLFF
jgi:hypothetical protein